MGGLIALRAGQRIYDDTSNITLNGVILSAPVIYPNPQFVTPFKRRMGALFSSILPKHIVNRLPITTLSSIEVVKTQYMQDRLNVTTGMNARYV